MKNTWKKYAAIAMAGVLSAGMLSGCGNKKEETAAFDRAQAVAVVNGEEIPMGVLSMMVRNQQAYIKAMYEMYGMGAYVSSIWDSQMSEESEQTYGEQTRDDVLNQIELMYILRNKAAEYGVEVTAEEKEKMAAAAAKFIETNSEETIKTLGVNAEDVQTYLELETYYSRMQAPISAGADHEVSDEQAQMSAFSFVHVTVKEEEAEGETGAEEAEEIVEEVSDEAEEIVEEASEEVEEIVEEVTEVLEDTEDAEEESEEESVIEEITEAPEEPKEPTEAELKAEENAAAFYEALAADPTADMSELAKTIDESLFGSVGTFQTNLSDDWEDATPSYLNEEMIEALRGLKEGEITPVIATEDDGFYIARLDKEMDESATARQRDSIISERESAYYSEVTQKWMEEAEISVDYSILSTLKVTNEMIFTLTSSALAGEEEEAVEAEEVEEAEETTEAPAEETTEAPVEETTEAPAEEAAEETETETQA